MSDRKSEASCSNQEQVSCVSTGTVGCQVDNHNNVLLQTGLAKVSNVSQSDYIFSNHVCCLTEVHRDPPFQPNFLINRIYLQFERKVLWRKHLAPSKVN